MGTLRRVFAPAVLISSLLAAACGGGGGNVAGRSPSPVATGVTPAAGTPSASPTPGPVAKPYGVLVGSQAATSYSVSLVGVDGKVAASAQATSPVVTSCGSVASAPFPLPVSTSDSRVYFMDASGAIHWLTPDGTKDAAAIATVPAATASRRSTFAVSPDDSEMAVAVATYTTTGAATSLYIYDLKSGGAQRLIFSQTGTRSLWPVGWRGTTSLVVAIVSSCTAGGGLFCCGMQELHVIDPSTAVRRFTLGTWATCPIAGPPSTAGAVCIHSPGFTSATYLNWTGATVKDVVIDNPASSFVSPDGNFVAFADLTGTSFTIGAPTIPDMDACTWIDSTHVLSGGDAQHQPRVADVVNGGVVPVPAVGDCGGRLPGGL